LRGASEIDFGESEILKTPSITLNIVAMLIVEVSTVDMSTISWPMISVKGN
jgi:hypothetical protein